MIRSGLRIRWWPEERTFCVTWGERGIVVGLTGRTRPSVAWHVRRLWREARP